MTIWPLIFLGFTLITAYLGFAVFIDTSAWAARIVCGMGLLMTIISTHLARGKA